MVTVIRDFLNGSFQALEIAPQAALGGAMIGYIYAKLADLPTADTVKAFLIYTVASRGIDTIATSFTPRVKINHAISLVVGVIIDTIAIREMEKRGVLGNKMKIALIAIRVLHVIGHLSKIVNKADTKEETKAWQRYWGVKIIGIPNE